MSESQSPDNGSSARRTAGRVLEIESQAIAGLIGRLDASFDRAVEMLTGCGGHYILTVPDQVAPVVRSIREAAEASGRRIDPEHYGAGFSFRGEYDNKALKEKRLGPLSLKHRVEEAGGLININSAPGGSTVVVRLPLSRENGE